MVTPQPIPSHAIILLLALSFAACGGDDPPQDATPVAPAADTVYTPLAREPLTEADLAGLALADLSVELPWTTNVINRNPVDHAPRASIRTADVSSHDGFDRVVFGFTDTTPFPGYRIDFVDGDTSIECGDNGAPYQVSGGPALVVRFEPARITDGDNRFLPTGLDRVSATRFQAVGVACEEESTITWVATLTSGQEVRVLELRGPNRLSVDVR